MDHSGMATDYPSRRAPKPAAAEASWGRPLGRPQPAPLRSDLVDSALDLVGGVVHALLEIALGLVALALGLEIGIVRELTRLLLGGALHLIDVLTHVLVPPSGMHHSVMGSMPALGADETTAAERPGHLARLPSSASMAATLSTFTASSTRAASSARMNSAISTRFTSSTANAILSASPETASTADWASAVWPAYPTDASPRPAELTSPGIRAWSWARSRTATGDSGSVSDTSTNLAARPSGVRNGCTDVPLIRSDGPTAAAKPGWRRSSCSSRPSCGVGSG